MKDSLWSAVVPVLRVYTLMDAIWKAQVRAGLMGILAFGLYGVGVGIRVVHELDSNNKVLPIKSNVR